MQGSKEALFTEGRLPPLRRDVHVTADASLDASPTLPKRGPSHEAERTQGRNGARTDAPSTNKSFFDKRRLAPVPPRHHGTSWKANTSSSATMTAASARGVRKMTADSSNLTTHGATTPRQTTSPIPTHATPYAGAAATMPAASARLLGASALQPLVFPSSSRSSSPPRGALSSPASTALATYQAPAPPAANVLFPLSEPPVREWVASARLERESGQRNLDLAAALFRQVVQASPQNALAITAAYRSAAAPMGSSGFSGDSPVDQLAMLATRAAVSALLLQETVLSLPRHQRMLEPYVRMLLRAVFVPDDATDATYRGAPLSQALDGGTLSFPPILEGLQVAMTAAAAAAAGASPTSTTSHEPQSLPHLENTKENPIRSLLPSSTGATVASAAVSAPRPDVALHVPGLPPPPRDSVYEDDYFAALLASGGRGASPEHLVHLLAPFARKPFFVALVELSQRVTRMAHAVRSQQLHVQKLPQLFAMTHVSWTKTLLRTVVRAWWKLCVERRVQAQKHRVRWAQRWSLERVRLGIRRWRGIAAYTLQTAEADSAAKAAITEKREIIHRYLADVESMRTTSRSLSLSLQVKEEERRTMEKALTDMEQEYRAALEKVRETDRVGTALLDYLLLPLTERGEALLHDRDMGTPRIECVSPGAQGLTHAPLNPASHDGVGGELLGQESEEVLRELRAVGASPMQQHYVGSLRVLVEWANHRLLAEGMETEELCAMSPEAAEKHLRRRREKASAPADGKASDQDEAATAADRDADTPEETGSTTLMDASSVALEPVFTQLLPSYSSPVSIASWSSDARDSTGADMSEHGGRSAGDPNDFVPIPLYKYLVLMRCFKQLATPTSAHTVVTQQAATAQRSSLVPLEVAMGHRKSAMEGSVGGSTNGGGGGGGGGFEVHPNAPDVSTVRMVKTADASVLESLRALHHLTSHRTPGRPLQQNSLAARDTQDALDGAGDSPVDLLPEDLRVTADDVAKIVVDSYERLTGTACVVSPEQLRHRGRGAQLVLLATLFRHYTNWAVRRAQVEARVLAEAPEMAREDASALRATLVASRTVGATRAASGFMGGPSGAGSAASHLGRRHPKYADWYAPPTSHRLWPTRVLNQKRWIALSFSALHRAVYESTRVRQTLSVEEQDLAVRFVRSLTLSRLVDVLPTSPDQTTHFYVGVVETMERCFSRLRHVFMLYAVPLHEIRAKCRAAETGSLATGAAMSSSASAVTTTGSRGASSPLAPSRQRTGGDSDDSDSFDTDEEREEVDGDGSDKDDDENAAALEEKKAKRRRAKDKSKLYMTANAFWHLLCDAGVAGGDNGATATSVTLHRAAVLSIVEHVVFRTLDAHSEKGESAGMGQGRHGAAKRVTGGAAASTAQGQLRARRPPRVGSSKVLPHFARAVIEERHVDLRFDRATLCMSADHFAEALVRCAHYWQAMQSAALRYDAYGESRAGIPAGAGGAGTLPGYTLDSSSASPKGLSPSAGRSRTSVGSSLVFPPPATAGGSSRRGSFVSGTTASTPQASSRLPSAAAKPATVPSVHVFVRYEGLVGDCAPLSPQLLETFLADWILPQCLSGPGGVAVAKGAGGSGGAVAGKAAGTGASGGGGGGGGGIPAPLSAFRRAIRHRSVQMLLAQHQEALFKVFSRYSKPREAFGMRSALPPPYSYSCDLPSPTRLTPHALGPSSAQWSRTNSPSEALLSPRRRRRSSKSVVGAGSSIVLRTGSRRRSSVTVPSGSPLTGNSRTYDAGGRLSTVSSSNAPPSRSRLRDVGIVAIMSLIEVEAMAKGLRWSNISADALRHCFTNVVADKVREAGAIFFTEFLDLLCALASYAEVDPLVPLVDKLERFLMEHVLVDVDLE